MWIAGRVTGVRVQDDMAYPRVTCATPYMYLIYVEAKFLFDKPGCSKKHWTLTYNDGVNSIRIAVGQELHLVLLKPQAE